MQKDDMYKAVMNNDEKYDGVFFYAVKTTGIYCKPSCKSKLPNRENIRYFNSKEEAEKAGYRACKRCRSDLTIYNPTKEISKKAKWLLENFYHDDMMLNTELKKLGISPRRIFDIFKEEYGITMFSFLNNLRIEKSKSLLIETDRKIIDVAFLSGFSSLSTFYRLFKKEMNTTPIKYRKTHSSLMSND